jgi:hypothetical protein
MTIDISNNDPRISYSVAQGVTQTSFAVPFEFFDDSDVNVYVDGTLKTITTDYTISGGGGSTGTVTISVTGASGGSVVVLTRNITIERTTDFTAGADINRAALNTQLDTLTAIAADVKDRTGLALSYNDRTVGAITELPDVSGLKGKTLSFNAATGAPEAGPSIGEISNAGTFATNASNSATAAATSASNAAATYDSFDDRYLGAKSTVSGDPTVDNDGDPLIDGALFFDTTNNVTKVYDLGTTTWLRTTPTSGDQANIDTVSGIAANVTTVAGISADVVTVADSAANISTVVTNIANVNLVGGSITNVNTVATNLASVNSFAAIYRIAASDPVDSLDEGDLVFNTADNKMKVYNGAAWQDVAPVATSLTVSQISDLTADATELNRNDITTLGTSEASKVVTADANGVVIFDAGVVEDETAVTSSSNATTVNCRDGNVFTHVLTENTTFTFSNPPASGRAFGFTLKIVQDASASGYTVTWPASVDWPSATAPTLTATASAVDVFVFYTHDSGTTFYGFVAGQALG